METLRTLNLVNIEIGSLLKSDLPQFMEVLNSFEQTGVKIFSEPIPRGTTHKELKNLVAIGLPSFDRTLVVLKDKLKEVFPNSSLILDISYIEFSGTALQGKFSHMGLTRQTVQTRYEKYCMDVREYLKHYELTNPEYTLDQLIKTIKEDLLKDLQDLQKALRMSKSEIFKDLILSETLVDQEIKRLYTRKPSKTSDETTKEH